MIKYEKDYIELCKRVINAGTWITNDRTGVRCLTVINHDFVYDVGAGEVPLLTQKQCFTVSAVAEVIGYWRRYTDAQQFADIGSPTWFANANENQAWLNNPNRKGENDMGIVYGAATGKDDLRNIYDDLSRGIDNRGEIYQMWRPDTFSQGCLRPCAYEHIWSLVGDKLSLTVVQRSCDLALGVPFNSFSFAAALKIMAKITGNVPDKVYHKLINVHVYADQLEILKAQIARPVIDCKPELIIEDWVDLLEDVVNNDRHARDYFHVEGYEHQGKVKYPFTA